MATQDLQLLDWTGASKTALVWVWPSSKIIPKSNLTDEAGTDITPTFTSIDTSLNNIETSTGTTADVAYTTGSGTIVSILKGIFTRLSNALSVTFTNSSIAVSNFPATQPVSATSLPLPSGASSSDNQTNWNQKTKIVNSTNNTIDSLSGWTGALGMMTAKWPTFYSTSAGNSSTANLAAGASFTGTIESVFNIPAIQVMIKSDKAFTLTVNQYIDSAGTKLVQTSRLFFREANVWLCENIQIAGNYYNIVVTNVDSATTTALTIETTQWELQVLPQSLSNTWALPVEIMDNETSTYFLAQDIVPTTLTTGLNFFCLRNTHAVKKIKIAKIEIIAFFTGTAAASRSLYNLKKFTGWTAQTGTAVQIEKGNTTNPTSIASATWLATGLTVTGATVSTANIASIWHANQLTANIVYDRDMEQWPLILGQNEGIVLQSNGAIVAGSTILLSIKFKEEI